MVSQIHFCLVNRVKLPPKTKQKSAMNRRARQNKAPESSLDLRPTTVNWNVNAERVPAFNNTIKRDNRAYTVMQTSNQSTVVSSDAAIPKFFTKGWTSADLLQFASYAAVFDQYRIDRIEAWLTPFGSATSNTYTTNAKLYSVVDYDDAATPASNAALQQYENCVTTRCSDGHYIKFRPHIAVAAYGGAFTQFLNKPSDWIDCGSTGVFHYGIKIGLDSTGSNNDCRVDLTTRITVSFRNVF